MALTASEVNELKQAHVDGNVLPIIRQRWSPRSFSDRSVDSADLHTIFEAARWAASSGNEQPWRFLVGNRGSATYDKIFGSLVESNQVWAGSAPVLILGVANARFSSSGSLNSFALHDLGAAAATICYQAMALGIHTHQMAGYDQGAARKAFGVPEDFIFGAVMAMGYLGEPSALKNESLLKREVAPRQRKALSDFVWSGWGEPAKL